MTPLREDKFSGRRAVAAAVALLRRVRAEHPTAGVWDASDIEWWWRRPRDSDATEQIFLSDDRGPVAAVVIVDWDDTIEGVPIVIPSASTDVLQEIWRRFLDQVHQSRYLRSKPLGVTVRDDDELLRRLLLDAGFEATADHGATAWMDRPDRVTVSALPAGYRLRTRADDLDGPHHLARRAGPQVAERLSETELYRRDLDLLVQAGDGSVAAYGLFWFDPATKVGSVEPMRTEDEHQSRGLARHVLTSGVQLLAAAGASRVKIGYALDNPVSGPLYRSVGFEVESTVTLYLLP